MFSSPCNKDTLSEPNKKKQFDDIKIDVILTFLKVVSLYYE